MAPPGGSAIRQSQDFSEGLLHRRNDEGCVLLHTARPAGSDCLDLGPELHALRAVLVGVAEGGALPAAECMVGERNRDRHIDADHVDLNLAGKAARRALLQP